ncbi:hypothetical protein BOX15_Mlig004300g2 [Macrostomum lignano]|uniref:Uncharacterized protein n=2 Tax=Macrostomum lignano TaxID=282301 RepID=A0A267EPX0_9PLAT|nr:hypothetical protein BOX15_Mlig004300g2 [Macrostomum lignano]
MPATAAEAPTQQASQSQPPAAAPPAAAPPASSAAELSRMREQVLRRQADVQQQVGKFRRTDFRRQVIAEHLAELKRYSRLTKKNVSVPLQRQPKSARIRVDTSKSHSNIDVVRLALQKLRWRELPNGPGPGVPCELCWNGLSFAENLGHPGGLVNRFPGMAELLHKINLSRTLETMRRLYPSMYDFYPDTWYLPFQMAEFQTHAAEARNRSKTYIVKPDSGTQGDGIYLIRDPSEYTLSNKSHVVQTYLPNPLLLDGYKFDLRVYVLLKSIEPLQLYICKEGLARFCTQRYERPSQRNMAEAFMHLTNYSLNKKSDTYVHSDVDGQGSKRTLSSVFYQLEAQARDVAGLWRAIEALCVKTIIAVLPELMVCVHHEIPPNRPGPRCFQILGFDIMILDDLTPMLLEVNNSPSLRLDFENELVPGINEYSVSVIDVQVKKPLVHDTLQLVESMMRPLSSLPAASPSSSTGRQKPELSVATLNGGRQLRGGAAASSGTAPKLLAASSARPPQQAAVAARGPANRRLRLPSPPPRCLTSSSSSPSPPASPPPPALPQPAEVPPSKTVEAAAPVGVSVEVTGCQPEGRPPTSLQQHPRHHHHHQPQRHGGRRRRNWIRANRANVSAKGSREASAAASAEGRPQHHPYDDEYEDDEDNCMEEIFPAKHKQLQDLRVLEGLKEIFLAAIGVRTNLKLGSTAFRNFARKCRLQESGLPLASVDIMYIDMQRRWEYLSSDPTAGLCFQGFVEAFFKIAEQRDPASSPLQAVARLADHCCRCMGLGGGSFSGSFAASETIVSRQQSLTKAAQQQSRKKPSQQQRRKPQALTEKTGGPGVHRKVLFYYGQREPSGLELEADGDEEFEDCWNGEGEGETDTGVANGTGFLPSI